MGRARSLVLSGSATAAMVLSVAFATPANAAVNRDFDRITAYGSGAADGRAHVYGTVRWNSKTSFTITGHINDWCNGGDGDGFGAYFNGTISYMDGTGRGMGNPNIAEDDRGCTEAAKSFTYTAPVSKNVRRINLVIQELDLNGGRAGEAVRWSMDNPYTG